MNIDEVEAFRLAIETAGERGWNWRAPYYLHLDDGEWQIQSEGEFNIRIVAASGEVRAESVDPYVLDPLAALTIAKAFATDRGLPWKPGFSLVFEDGCWVVGSSQSQFGGQRWIFVGEDGRVVRHEVNPK